MCQVHIVKASSENFFSLIGYLRDDDREELRLQGTDEETAMMTGAAYSSIKYALVRNNKTIGVYGVLPIQTMNRIAAVYYLGTDESIHIPKVMLKEGRRFIKECLEKYDLLFNIVWKENKTHIEYIKRLGFIISPEIIRINKGEFYLFYIRK